MLAMDKDQAEPTTSLVKSAELETITLTRINMDTPVAMTDRGGHLDINLNISGEVETGGVSDADGRYRVDVRVSITGTPHDDGGEETDGSKMELLYQTVYKLSSIEDWPQEQFDYFNMNCAGYHTWPYIRELIHNLTARSPIPPITLPMLPIETRE